jgi:hypothetical protein
MSALQFRAILFDPGDLNPERPIQIVGADFQEVERWAVATVEKAKSPEAVVNIYQTIEQKIKVFRKKKEVARDDKGRCSGCSGTGKYADGLYCNCDVGRDLRLADTAGAARLRRADEDAAEKLRRITGC